MQIINCGDILSNNLTLIQFFQRFFSKKVTGVFNSIKDAFPNFEEDQSETFSNVNNYKLESKLNLEYSTKTSGFKSTKSFLLPDFFTSSNVPTPNVSPSIENPCLYTKENSKVDGGDPQKIRFKFAACDVEVNLLLTT